MAQYRLERLAPVASDLEQLGTKEKFWFSMDTEPKLWLFKFSRAGTGEHWSENVRLSFAIYWESLMQNTN